jgi:hypothetical protein
VTRDELLIYLNHANSLPNESDWDDALAVAGAWVKENGGHFDPTIASLCAILWSFKGSATLGPLPFQYVDGKIVAVDDEGAATNLAEPPPGTILRVAPDNFAHLLTAALSVARETTLDFDLPAVESLNPRLGVLQFEGPDHMQAVDMVVNILNALGVLVKRGPVS